MLQFLHRAIEDYMNVLYLIIATFFMFTFKISVHAEIEAQLRPIGWSAVSLETTFEKAKKENKLVFLYWGPSGVHLATK